MTAVAGLVGDVLDYWVARAIGNKPGSRLHFPNKPGASLVKSDIPSLILHLDDVNMVADIAVLGGTNETGAFQAFNPSKNWALAGPMIESVRIDLRHRHDVNGRLAGTCFAWAKYKGKEQHGPTDLIAAMRALVASVYGDTVPDEVSS